MVACFISEDSQRATGGTRLAQRQQPKPENFALVYIEVATYGQVKADYISLQHVVLIECSLPVSVDLLPTLAFILHRGSHVDGGKNNDIFDINHALGLNLFEGDIDLGRDRSSLIGDNTKWPHRIPYILANNLEMNAKGIILRAFERYRLKTCIDFKELKEEDNYIYFYKGRGCNSRLGNRHSGKQTISIGKLCDKIGIVQHELFHALGFVHEHSRTDRDDYITVMMDRIFPGKESNFFCFGENVIESLNVPYDYTSVMHYPKTAFQRGTEPTIITKNPNFMDVIGQRFDFSDYDIERLNRRYNCSSSITFLDSCDFELENICGMIQSSEDDGDWQRVSQVPGGPDTDQSSLDKCIGVCFFMHFNSSSVNEGGKAILESRVFYPKREFQCLQFYYYNSGSTDDKLKIYVKEYSTAHHRVSLTLVDEVKDVPIGSWQLYYVSLAASNKFRVVFEGTRGVGTSGGGISIDDINLSETWCPHHIWRISNFTQVLSSRGGTYSPPFYSNAGYAFQVYLDVNDQTNIGIYFSLISGANDEQLVWPCIWQQATMTLLDQNPDIRRQMSNERSVTTDPFKTIDSDNEVFFWDKPSKVGRMATFPNGTSYSRGRGYGTGTFITHKWLHSRDFIKGDTIYILLTMEGMSI
ncbi:meprin A subunit beta-like [Trichosurus vulpecula]|uniref:meprin A subunit beta-like n=1 Tax=Trichosurus vulpecula TaxID=9337 RepID=UPI00186AF23D|nr:meprin A subunit beta-like [Trichosurus vulpecula]